MNLDEKIGDETNLNTHELMFPEKNLAKNFSFLRQNYLDIKLQPSYNNVREADKTPLICAWYICWLPFTC